MEYTSWLNRIIELEWEMFSSVTNAGGPASCQNDLHTFQIMRRSQVQTWSPALLQSYMEDLDRAQRAGVNLMTQKYARMMEYTHPDEYEQIKDQLPFVDEQTIGLIDEIIVIHLQWEQELSTRFPYLRAQGRLADHASDSSYHTSIATYLRSELLTLSPSSIEIYYHDTIQARDNGINLAEENLLYIVRAYGHSTLEDADKRLSKKK